ncbi:MAG: type IV secretion system DNA-binding domain-containing protein [Anaerolineae bacterium]|nr:type IV secretion system DNA-binding domain-containing protein [Anaerolineae bacterium]
MTLDDNPTFPPKPHLPNLLVRPLVLPDPDDSPDGLGFRATFAFDITGCRPLSDPTPVLQAWLGVLDGLRVAQDTVHNRHGLELRLRLRLRLVSGNTPRVIILGHAEALDEHTARQAGETWLKLMQSQLPSLNVGLFFKPLDVIRLITPTAPGILSVMPVRQAAAVVRRETSLLLEDSSVYVRNALSRMSGGAELLAMMATVQHLSVVDVQCTPTEITPAERQAAAESAGIWSPSANDLTQMDHQKEMAEAARRQFLSERMTGAGSRYTDFMTQASDGLYEVRVQVISSEPSADLTPLAHQVGKTLFGVFKYDVVGLAPALCDGLDVRNVCYAPRWAHSLAPMPLRRLRDVFTPAEALMVTSPPLPTPVGLPGLVTHRSKVAPMRATQPPRAGVVIGDAVRPIPPSPVPVAIPSTVRTRHTYLVGKTGVGKTTALVNLAIQDMAAGHGVAFIDPHGDAAQDLLLRVPEHRAADVIYFDMSDSQQPLGFNIMGAKDVRQQDNVIREFIALLIQLYDPQRIGIIGPRFEQMVMVAMSIAFAVKDATLHEVVRALSDRDFAREAVKYVTNPVVRTLYDNVVAEMNSSTRSEIMDWLTSKFAHFLVDQTVRHAVTRSTRTLDFRQIMDEGKILIVNLSKGAIGQDNAQFIGLLLLPQLLLAAFTRANQAERERRLFCVYVDEFHNFKTPALQTALAEGRKYGLSLTLANQFVTQVDTPTRQAIFGNAGTIGVFRVGIEDAQVMERELVPVFSSDDLMNLPSYQLALKLADTNEVVPPFLVYTRPLPLPFDAEAAEGLRARSREAYGMEAEQIEAEIRERYTRKPTPADPNYVPQPEPPKPPKPGGLFESLFGSKPPPPPPPVEDALMGDDKPADVPVIETAPQMASLFDEDDFIDLEMPDDASPDDVPDSALVEMMRDKLEELLAAGEPSDEENRVDQRVETFDQDGLDDEDDTEPSRPLDDVDTSKDDTEPTRPHIDLGDDATLDDDEDTAP